MASVNELYQEIIIDHGSCPRNEGELAVLTHAAEGYNATCGDELSISLLIKNDIIEDVKFRAQGCSISKASGSMMTEKIRGMPTEEALNFSKNLQKMLNSDPLTQINEAKMGDLVALLGVKQFPMRVKCATLAWHVFENALKGNNSKE
jgi:nitrogen fixation NifU-like protein